MNDGGISVSSWRRKARWLALLVGVTAWAALAQTPFGAPHTPPPLLPTPTPACPNAPPPRLIVGLRARVSLNDERPLNVRERPGTQAAVVGQIEPGSVFVVLEGPACSARYAWYRIARGSLTGWVAEGDSRGYFVEPYPPG
jgi:hypothetical protein